MPPVCDTRRSALDLLEVVPGVSVRQVLAAGWPADFDGNLQIGRQPPLSSNKAATHFPRLRGFTGVPYDRMLFFDDCNWGDHCGAVSSRRPRNPNILQNQYTHKFYGLCVLMAQG
jgi:magnesium-dependent phosphatase 1